MPLFKYFPVLFLLFMAFSGYGQQKYNLEISAEAVGLKDSSTFRLMRVGEKGMNPVDEAEAIPGEPFRLQTRIEGSGFYQITLSQDKYIVLVTEPGEQIQLQFELEAINKVKVKGSPATRLFYDILPGYTALQEQKDSLENVYSAMEQRGKTPTKEEQEALVESYREAESGQEEIIATIIKEHPAKLTGLMFVEILDMEEHFEILKAYASRLHKEYPENSFVDHFHNRIRKAEKTAIGATAPDIELPDPDNNPLALSDIEGKVVMIDFWASWCSYCRKENPQKAKLYQKYKDEGFNIYGVSLDKNRENWLKAINDDSLTWNHVSELNGWETKAKDIYNVSSVPYTILINEEGKIIAKGLRGDELKEKLRELFGY
ncbi:MAG: TlpA disulfide reductase family protein [Bacteroidales bacterium]